MALEKVLKFRVDGVEKAITNVEELESTIKTLEEQSKKAKFGSQEFTQLNAELKEARTQLKDFELSIEALDKEQRATALVDTFNGLTGAVGAVSSAFLAFGVESEAIEGVEKKLLGVIGVVSGLRDASNAVVAVQKLYGPAFSNATTAVKTFFATGTAGAKAFKAAIASIGIGALIAGIAYLVENFDELKYALTGVDGEAEEVKKTFAEAREEIRKTGEEARLASSVSLNELSNRFEAIKSAGQDVSVVFDDIKKVIPALNDANIETAEGLDRVSKEIEKYKNNQEEKIAVDTKEKELLNLIQQQTALVEKGKYSEAKATQNQINTLREQIATLNTSINTYDIFNRQIQQNIANQQAEDAQRKANQAKYKAIADERKKRAQQLADEVELIGLSEVETAKLLAKREFEERINGFKEGSQAYKDALTLYNEEIRQIDEEESQRIAEAQQTNQEEANARTKEEFDTTLANLENYYTQRLTKIKENLLKEFNEGKITQEEFQEQLGQAELENQAERLNAQLVAYEDYQQDTTDVLAEQTENRIALSDSEANNEKKNAEAIKQAKLQILGSASSIFGSLSQLSSENEKRQKAFGLAQIATDTAIALTNAQASAFSPASPDNAFTGGLAGVAKYASYVAIILSNVAKAKQILTSGNTDTGGTASTGAPAGGGGRDFGGSSSASLGAPQLFSGQTTQSQSQGGKMTPIKTYVLAGDITSAQNAEAKINQRRTL